MARIRTSSVLAKQITLRGKLLVERLNKNPKLKFLETLIEQTRRLTAIAEAQSGYTKLAKSERASFWKEVSRFDAISRKYSWYYTLAGREVDWRQETASTPMMLFETPTSRNPTQHGVTADLGNWAVLLNSGNAWRIRQCQLASCQRYFFATRPQQLFDTVKCKRKSHRSGDEAKKQHREYMRNYYREHLSSAARGRKRR